MASLSTDPSKKEDPKAAEEGAEAVGEKEDAGDEDEDEEEDPRIAKLKAYAAKHTVEDTIEILTTKIGAKESFKPAVIGGSMCFKASSVMAFLLGEAVLNAEGGKVSAQLKGGKVKPKPQRQRQRCISVHAGVAP